MKIDKIIHGFTFRYSVSLLPNSMKCKVRFLSTEDEVIGDISSDFQHIVLPDDYLSPFITDYGRVKVGKLKMNKRQQSDARDYNWKEVVIESIDKIS